MDNLDETIKCREAAVTMKCDYILGEYTNLMDAWKVYQGVALYRSMSGGGLVSRGV